MAQVRIHEDGGVASALARRGDAGPDGGCESTVDAVRDNVKPMEALPQLRELRRRRIDAPIIDHDDLEMHRRGVAHAKQLGDERREVARLVVCGQDHRDVHRAKREASPDAARAPKSGKNRYIGRIRR